MSPQQKKRRLRPGSLYPKALHPKALHRRLLAFPGRRSAPGTAPGTLTAPEVQRVEEVTIQVLAYDGDEVQEAEPASIAEALDQVGRRPTTWINVVGLHDLELLRMLGDRLGLHSLALEDVLHTHQRPKLEEYDDHLFIVLRQIHGLDGDPGKAGNAPGPGAPAGTAQMGERPAGEAPGGAAHRDLLNEQVTLFLGPGYVLTLQEVARDVFEPVRERIRRGRGRIRQAGPAYLAYALIDALVDRFFPLLEDVGERIEVLEDELMERPSRDTLGRIHALRRELLALRRSVWPLREVINGFERQEPPLVGPEMRVFLRDLYDHSIQILDVLETYRDLATGMLDVYLSSVSNRMNEVMKVLTVMASIFIPLTFLAGIYGMNFDPQAGPLSMPELGWAWSYPVLWLVMITIAGGLWWYFRRRGWVGR